MIVIDASVLTGFLLRREESTTAVREAVGSEGYQPLHAPEVIEPETLNALRKVVRHRIVTPRRATEAVADLGRTRLIRYPHEPLRPRMWELRDQLSAYDAAYLALAELLGDTELLTADRGLAKVARRVLGADAVTVVA